jgi:hypothetical protein
VKRARKAFDSLWGRRIESARLPPSFGLHVLGDLGAEGETEGGVVHAEPRSG